MKTLYEIVDEIITKRLGEPDLALGGYVLNRGNLQNFAFDVEEAVAFQLRQVATLEPQKHGLGGGLSVPSTHCSCCIQRNLKATAGVCYD